MKIELLNNGGKSWEKIGNSYIKGFAFINDKLLSTSDIIEELKQSIIGNNLDEKMETLA